MKIKVLEIDTIKKSNNVIINVADIEIIEGDVILPNNKYISEDGTLEFVLQSIGKYNPFVEKKYPCILSIEDNINLKKLKGKVFKVIT